MKQIFYITTILLFLLTGLISSGQVFAQTTITAQADTITSQSNSTRQDPGDDFSPGQFFFLLIGIGFLLICVGAGIALTALGLFIIFALVSFGVLSTSIIVGLNKKSFAKGFKTFIVLASSVGGILCWSAGFWSINKFSHWWTTQTALISGAAFGLVAGLIFGLLLYYVLKLLTTYFKQKLKLATGS